MKSILMSIKPQWVAKILNGEKTIEIRKKFPKDYVGWVYIYCTKARPYLTRGVRGDAYPSCVSSQGIVPHHLNSRVVARFWCDKVEELTFLEGLYDPLDRGYCTDTLDNAQVEIKSCVSQENLIDYLYIKGKGYAIHITELEIFDKPKEISEFKRVKWSKCGVKDKNGLYQCHKCPYAIHYGYGFGDCGYERPLKAPQSWCYIEV